MESPVEDSGSDASSEFSANESLDGLSDFDDEVPVASNAAPTQVASPEPSPPSSPEQGLHFEYAWSTLRRAQDALRYSPTGYHSAEKYLLSEASGSDGGTQLYGISMRPQRQMRGLSRMLFDITQELEYRIFALQGHVEKIDVVLQVPGLAYREGVLCAREEALEVIQLARSLHEALWEELLDRLDRWGRHCRRWVPKRKSQIEQGASRISKHHIISAAMAIATMIQLVYFFIYIVWGCGM